MSASFWELKMRQIERLNQILRVWEDGCYMAKMAGQAQVALGMPPKLPLTGPVQHFEELRPHLLGAIKTRFDERRFIPYVGEDDAIQQVFGVLHLLPAMLFCWNGQSRRVFRMDEDLQILLDATSLDRMRWQDVVMPFESFVITLERPIEGDQGIKYDCILVGTYRAEKEDKSDIVEIRLLPTILDDYKPISHATRKAIERAAYFKQWQEVINQVNIAYKQYKDCRGKRGSVFMVDMSLGETLVTDSMVDLVKRAGFAFVHAPEKKLVPEWDVAARIVVGMCLYLQTLPPGSPHKSDWVRTEKPKRPDPRSITDGASICTVSSSYKLQREEREALGLNKENANSRLTGYEVRAHFRMGHWRRAPGSGSDPNAPRIVHVRPTIVRRDRLEESSLPGGTETVL